MQQTENKPNMKKVCILLLAAYVLLAPAFYFLAGDRLLLRDSRRNVPLPEAGYGAAELSSGVTVEQAFSTQIQRLESVSVRWGTYYRSNYGTITVSLYERGSGRLLLEEQYPAGLLKDGGVTTLTFPGGTDLCGVPLILRLTADSAPGEAAAPLLSGTGGLYDDAALTVNGAPVGGSLCMELKGQELIWTGLHFPALASGGLCLLALWCWSMLYRVSRGKYCGLYSFLCAIRRYRFLVKQLVMRDFRAKYRRSVLGVLWSFLNPLLTMGVQYIVFSALFGGKIPHYAVYLLCGIVTFGFFSESCSLTLDSITANTGLITKVYVPKYIYPLTRTLSSLINYCIALLPLLLAALVSGIRPTRAWLILPFPVLTLGAFTLGLGMLLACSMVYFRDTRFLWNVFSMIWMYLTPLFYSADMLPDSVRWILRCNPLYYYVSFLRTLLMEGISPEPRVYFMCLVFAAFMLLLGGGIFRAKQDDFILYL